MAPVTGLVKHVGGSDKKLESPRAFQRYAQDCLHKQVALVMEIEVTLDELARKRSRTDKREFITASGPGEVRYDDQLLPCAMFLSSEKQRFITIIVTETEVRVTYESNF